jgi:hypothetical protein
MLVQTTGELQRQIPAWLQVLTLETFMSRELVTEILNYALFRLIDEQAELLDLNVTERTVSHHLARYLAQLFPEGYHVDVEYNRHGEDPKRLNLPSRKALDRELLATTVFPDILVHKRNTNDMNLLVLEMKKPGEGIEYDEIKLKAFRSELGYSHAAHIILGKVNNVVINTIIWVDG